MTVLTSNRGFVACPVAYNHANAIRCYLVVTYPRDPTVIPSQTKDACKGGTHVTDVQEYCNDGYEGPGEPRIYMSAVFSTYWFHLSETIGVMRAGGFALEQGCDVLQSGLGAPYTLRFV